ncbi:MAG: ATP-binding cassette domain-containing protein [Clostridiales bacterium]|nr:ATP-binding cassette domain-containing protein [Clostridiales bacterium]
MNDNEAINGTTAINTDKEKGEPLIRIQNLKKYFTLDTDLLGRPVTVLKAVDDVSFDIYKGEAFGLVGESGCGKTTIGKMLVNLYRPTAGKIIFEGNDLTALSDNKRREYCKDIQLIFQDPYASLNPRMTIGDIIAEPIRINKMLPSNEVEGRVNYLLNCVGLANHHRNRYPHEFSGGQRQRVGIARALALKPKLIVCDEPVSALDVSIQAQVLNLLYDLKNEFGLTYLFIAHGLNVVKHISDRVGVMYLGKLMEIAPKKEFYNNPLNPYTQALLSAIPSTDVTKKKERIILTGDVPSPINPGAGCRFASRCFKAFEGCDRICPELKDAGNNHFVACRLY